MRGGYIKSKQFSIKINSFPTLSLLILTFFLSFQSLSSTMFIGISIKKARF